MSDKTMNTTIEILGKYYSIRCPETELKGLQTAATFLNQKMAEIQKAGNAINLERIAIIAALNITFQLMQIDERLAHLQDKLDVAIRKALQTEMIYTAE